MEMSFCHLGFARPVVLLPKAQMLVTTVFPEFAGEGEGVLECGRKRQTDGAEVVGKLEGKPLSEATLFLVLFCLMF